MVSLPINAWMIISGILTHVILLEETLVRSSIIDKREVKKKSEAHPIHFLSCSLFSSPKTWYFVHFRCPSENDLQSSRKSDYLLRIMLMTICLAA